MREDADVADGSPLPIYACNWQTVGIFCGTWNQWIRVFAEKLGLVRLGIDWRQVESALTLSGIKRREWTVIFEGLREMQRVAKNILNGEDDGL